MKQFFRPNITGIGRWLRAASGALMLLGGIWCLWQTSHGISGIILAGLGAFVLFEASRGWCLLRACGIKTKF